jgi:hypothetical protein
LKDLMLLYLIPPRTIIKVIKMMKLTNGMMKCNNQCLFICILETKMISMQ